MPVIMLSGLSSKYDPMVITLENPTVNITSDLIKSKLSQEDKRKPSEYNGSNNFALYSSRNPIFNSNYNNEKSML